MASPYAKLVFDKGIYILYLYLVENAPDHQSDWIERGMQKALITREKLDETILALRRDGFRVRVVK